MKTFKIFLFFFLMSFLSYSQISVSRSHRGMFKDLKKEDYKEIKRRKTIFVVDSFDAKKFEEMLNSFWTLNKFEVLTRSQYEFSKKDYINENYSIFEFSGVVEIVSGQQITSEYLFLNYNYFYYKKTKTKYEQIEVASIFFSGDAESMWYIIRSLSYGNLKQQLYNYKLGFIKNYLQFIQNNLKDDWYSWAFTSSYEKKQIKLLSKLTLYVPEYIKTKYSGWTGEDEERENPDKLFKNYDFKYEWISSEELNKKILSTNEDFFYIMYTKINSVKLINIINGKTGEIIYRDCQLMSYQLKAKDLNTISKKIN